MLEHLIDASLNAAPISPLTICPSVSKRWGSLLNSSTSQERFYVFPRPFSMTREKFSAILARGVALSGKQMARYIRATVIVQASNKTSSYFINPQKRKYKENI